MASRTKWPRIDRSNSAGTSQQSTRRVNSVYDLTSLRLHPDGLRAQDPSSSIWVGNRFHRPTAIQDRHGNILAPDAVGMPYLKRKRSASPQNRRQRASDDEEEENFEDEFNYSDDDQPQHKGRARLRRSFFADYSFLDEPETEEEKQREEMRRLYHPSSDLLKYVHHYASQLYAADGELFDVHHLTQSKERPARSEHTSRASSPAAHPSDISTSSSESSTSSSSEHEGDNGGEKDQPPPTADPEGLRKLQKGKRKTGLPVGRPITTGTYQARKEQAEKRAKDKARVRQPKAKRNMYRAFDGSALFCIGLLVQEHIAKMIDQPPRLKLDPQLEGLGNEELQERYKQAARELQEEEEDAVEREVRRRMNGEYEQS